MMKINYKNEAHNLYKSNQLFEAYKCAWNLPFTEFLPWFTDFQGKRKPTKKTTFFNNPFFYNSFLITQSLDWLRCTDAILLWEYYLDSQIDVSLEFEWYVAHNNPSLFIEGYKNKLAFLNGNRLKQLQELHLPLSIVKEVKIWYKFNSLLTIKWNNVLELFENVKLAPPEKCMAICAAFEAFIYKNPDDKLRWHYAVETLSLLIAFIQNKYNLSKLQVNEIALAKAYCEGAIELKGKALFQEVYDYILLREKTQRYTYEPDLKVFIDNNEVLQFQESDAFNLQWKYDEHRYTVNERYYYTFGEQSFNKLKSNNEINYINDNKDLGNQLGNARQLGIKQTIYDLGIRDEDLKNKKLPNLDFMISFLHGIAWRKLETSEKPLHDIARFKKNTYAEGIAELIHKSQNSEAILISDKDLLYNAAKASGLSCSSQELSQLIRGFSFKWKVEIFDPFKMSLSLWKKPFIQMGKNIISPIGILTGFTGLYTISESILKNFKPGDGTRIEKILKNYYKDSKWKTFVINEVQEYGDVDLVMEDDKNIVFMQLKRTTQKTNMLELHNQRKQDRKARKQLSVAKAGNTSKKNIHLWYVTTAFEKVGTWEKDIFRVSYQDLIRVKRLLDSDGLRFNSLNDFIEMIESDTPYKIGKEHILN